MTFKYVFWEDAMAIKNARDLGRLICIMCSMTFAGFLALSTSANAIFEHVSFATGVTFTSLVVLFLIGVAFYLNAALQGLELTEEWVNDGDRDGRYWLEQVIIANTLFFSFILFLIAIFMQDYFMMDGVFTASQLLFELPVVYFVFVVTIIGFMYTVLLFGLIAFASVRNIGKEINLFKKEQRELYETWKSLSTENKKEVATKIKLLSDAMSYYPKLTRKQKQVGKRLIYEMFFDITNECYALSKQKNLLK